jgi:hypothetical protein
MQICVRPRCTDQHKTTTTTHHTSALTMTAEAPTIKEYLARPRPSWEDIREMKRQRWARVGGCCMSGVCVLSVCVCVCVCVWVCVCVHVCVHVCVCILDVLCGVCMYVCVCLGCVVCLCMCVCNLRCGGCVYMCHLSLGISSVFPKVSSTHFAHWIILHFVCACSCVV